MNQHVVHDRGRADQTMQHRLIKHHRHVGRIGPVEDHLTVNPRAHQRANRLIGGVRLLPQQQDTSVIGRLQQTGYHDR